MLRFGNVEIDDTVKPAIEWIDGRPIQKLMPTDFHAFVQSAFIRLLYSWAKTATGGRGRVGSEWRFKVPVNAYDTLSVVPDVAYLATYFDLPKADRRYPNVAPDIVVEVRSPDDDEAAVAKKREFYLWWGVKLVLTADPELRTIDSAERDGLHRHFAGDATVTSSAFPTLALSLAEIFAELDDPA